MRRQRRRRRAALLTAAGARRGGGSQLARPLDAQAHNISQQKLYYIDNSRLSGGGRRLLTRVLPCVRTTVLGFYKFPSDDKKLN